MAWIAAGAGTLVAACLIYSFLKRHADNDLQAQSSGAAGALRKEEVRDDDNITNLIVEAGTKHSSNGSVPVPPIVLAPEEPTAPSIVTSSAVDSTSMPPPPTIRKESSLASNSNGTISNNTMLPPPRPIAPRQQQQPQLPTARNSSSPPRLKPPTMAPPPRPSAASTLRVPVTKALSNSHMQPASSTLPPPQSSASSKSRKSRQITLAPGFSPLDWASLTKSRSPTALTTLLGRDFQRLSPSGALLKIPPSLLKHQNGRKGKDAWTSYKGRVYNITPYLPYHPGGKAELLRAAGREGEALFMEVHPWVNWEGMLGECCVGILVGEGEGSLRMVKGGGQEQKQQQQQENEENELDEMD